VPSVAVLGFLVAIVPIALTPGASFTLVTQRTLAGQRRAAGWVIAGTATGTYIHAMLAAAGLSALVMRSAEAFTVVKIVGGIYLILLGAWTLWQTRRRRPVERKAAPRLPWAGHHSYPQAVLANLLNPKATSVYLTLAPQFLSAAQMSMLSMITLASVHVLVMATWLLAWSAVLRTGRTIATSDRFARIVNRLGGTILIALGVKTAAT
jgi:threonine/homoserine/homoserine lactone efflux protein